MYWVVQNNIYSEEGHEKLISALERLNLPYSLHKVVPFVGTLEPDACPPDGPVIVMGSYTLAHHAQKRGWKPGAFLNDNFNQYAQMRHWRERMLNWDCQFWKFGKVPPQEKPFFIRPVDDSKAFSGQVMDWPSFEKWREGVLSLTPEDNSILNSQTFVQICKVKEIYTETRVWMVDSRAITASGYKRGTIKLYSDVVDPRIIEFAEGHTWAEGHKWEPHRAYVMDIADTPEGLKIVEVNNLNSAGFYKADMNKLVMALENAFG